MLESRLLRHELKLRKVIAIILILLGLIICAIGVWSWIVDARSTVSSTMTIILGVLLFLGGILIFITEMFESWLSRGQAALVDGLQAG